MAGMGNKHRHACITHIPNATRYTLPEPLVFNSAQVERIGIFAMDMVVKWGMVAGVPDGEDSTGRQRLRLQTPEELVERALKTANILFDTMEREGMIARIPTPTPNND